MAFHIGLIDGQLGFEGSLLRYVDLKRQRILPRSIYSKGIASLVDLQRHLKLQVHALCIPALDSELLNLPPACRQLILPEVSPCVKGQPHLLCSRAVVDYIHRIGHRFTRCRRQLNIRCVQLHRSRSRRFGQPCI
ncbi:hypothetical protein D3C73_1094520 [compost metagenome]